MAAHLTISATDFKAKCLDIFTRLADRRLNKVTVTRRGKPVAELFPPAPQEDRAAQLFDALRGTVTIPPGLDLTQPVFNGEIDAENGILHN